MSREMTGVLVSSAADFPNRDRLAKHPADYVFKKIIAAAGLKMIVELIQSSDYGLRTVPILLVSNQE